MKLNQLTKEDFRDVLENYEIGDYRDHKYLFTGGNLVYKLKTTKGKYILKVYGK
jgi:Ser/Thr protein kinase RdoA (MazF antagonist)